jgi:hypothetical protein
MFNRKTFVAGLRNLALAVAAVVPVTYAVGVVNGALPQASADSDQAAARCLCAIGLGVGLGGQRRGCTFS